MQTAVLVAIAAVVVRLCRAVPGPCSMGDNGLLGTGPGNNTVACTKSCMTTKNCAKGYCNGPAYSACQCTNCGPVVTTVDLLRCGMAGDPHIDTFYGGNYDPQPGPGARWLAAQPRTPIAGVTPWAVYFTSHFWPGDIATCVDDVFVVYDGVTIQFGRSQILQVNGITRTANFSYPSPKNAKLSVVVYQTLEPGLAYRLTTSENLIVTYEPHYGALWCATVEIQVKPSYSGNLVGYCAPETIPTTTPLSCSSTQVTTPCAPLKDANGIFAGCVRAMGAAKADKYYNRCVYDLCLANLPTVLELCSSVYTQFGYVVCPKEAPTIALQWPQSICPMKPCGANSALNKCGSTCTNTCANPNATKTCQADPSVKTCLAQCQCNDGFVYENGQCVLASACGCSDIDGNYHTAQESWMTSNCTQKCSCVLGKPQCTPVASCALGTSCICTNTICGCGERWNRVTILVTKHVNFGDQLFIRGGIPDAMRPYCSNTAEKANPCVIPIRHIDAPIGDAKVTAWRYRDDFLDWYGPEASQGVYVGEKSAGTPLYWTTGDVWKAEFDANCDKGISDGTNVNFWFKVYVRYANKQEAWLGNADIVGAFCPASGMGARTISTVA